MIDCSGMATPFLLNVVSCCYIPDAAYRTMITKAKDDLLSHIAFTADLHNGLKRTSCFIYWNKRRMQWLRKKWEKGLSTHTVDPRSWTTAGAIPVNSLQSYWLIRSIHFTSQDRWDIHHPCRCWCKCTRTSTIGDVVNPSSDQGWDGAGGKRIEPNSGDLTLEIKYSLLNSW